MKIKNPGEVEILELSLTHKEGALDLTPITTFIDVFESVKSPVIKGVLQIKDSLGMIDSVDMVGSTVKMKFTTETDLESEFIFKIYSVDNITTSESGKVKYYSLMVASEEMLNSAAINISQNFVDMSHEKIIAILIEKYLKSKKRLKYEATLGIDTVPLTKLKPFQAIDKVRRRSVSKKNKSSSYCFYESREGYNFVTIEYLMSEGKKDVGDRFFYYDAVGKNSSEFSDWRNVLAMEQVKVQNAMEMIARGGIKNNVWAFNLQTGEYKKAEFDKMKNDGEFNIDPESFNLSKDLINKFSESEAMNMLIPINDERELNRVEKQSYLRGYVMRLLSNIINISIHGDSTMIVGKAIHIDFPVADGMSRQKKNELLSGYYLITKLRHIISIQGKPNYMQSCELLRTGFLKE